MARGGRKALLAKALNLVKERKAVSVAELSLNLDRSYKYVRYYLLPELAAMSECIEVTGDTVAWVCEGEEA